MKQRIFSTLLIFLIINISYTSFAQQNYVYDGDTFNVWFKTNPANDRVTEVYFTAEDQWHKFTLIDFQSHDDKGNGFAFRAKDGAGRYYWIDYFRQRDYIVVTDEQDDEKWTLYRRKN
jgi:uncharacterized protein YxeA